MNRDARLWATRWALAAAATAFAASASVGVAQGGRDGRGLRPAADPGVVVATEIAFARLAKEKGQWTAFAKFAAPDAVMFVPEPVRAQKWLKRQRNPVRSVTWEPYQLWTSCDGTIAVTRGPWTGADGSVGYFTTIWQRQKDDTYRWVLDQGDTLAKPLTPPDLVQADVADCPARKLGAFGGPPRDDRRGKFAPAPVAADGLSGTSSDGSLSWSAAVAPDKSRELHVSLKRGEAMKEVLASSVAAPR
ncbi:MAG: hypothetical protein P0Y56_09175 [Candidatus Andeanibacterium colombiense]|uniref:DUF4440 domain-containing protein n=1 Tax=Candidatus Andeanibacterium colombiense TaxID=3121345 RepID=A0AAJ5X3K9_9SPHN|nr:MAG: hypothetical protein P0Y56_09175 [Sphingomonadaceae bacterium]